MSELLPVLKNVNMRLSEALLCFNSDEHLILPLFTIVYWHDISTESLITYIAEQRIKLHGIENKCFGIVLKSV